MVGRNPRRRARPQLAAATAVDAPDAGTTGHVARSVPQRTSGDRLLYPVYVAIDQLHMLLSGGVNNLADKRYVGFVNINSTAGEFYEAGEPRNGFVGLNVAWSME